MEIELAHLPREKDAPYQNDCCVTNEACCKIRIDASDNAARVALDILGVICFFIILQGVITFIYVMRVARMKD